MNPTRVILVRGTNLLAEGIHRILQYTRANQITLAATFLLPLGSDSTEAIRREEPDVVLIDLTHQPHANGEVVERISRTAPGTRTIAFSSDKDGLAPERLSRLGVWGALHRGCQAEVLFQAIQAVADGKKFFDGKVYESDYSFAGSITAEDTDVPTPQTSLDCLTQREKEVFALVAKGLHNREIADRLCISVRTVENHRAHVMEKLELHNVVDLVRLARDLNIV